MSSRPDHLSLLNTPSRKRTRGPEDDLHVSNQAKRRRSSLLYGTVLFSEPGLSSHSHSIEADSRDRFLPSLTSIEPYYHLNRTSPRSVRFGRTLGLVQSRLLSFHDDTLTPLLDHQLSDSTLLMRTHLSQSIGTNTVNSSITYSAANHGRIKPDRVLDSGPMDNFPLHPCAWSSTDAIAAVIRGRVFIHDMVTNTVSNLTDNGMAECVEWTRGNELAVGNGWGGVALVDPEVRKLRKYHLPLVSLAEITLFKNVSHINGMSWTKEQGVLAVGRANGAVSYIDPRIEGPIRNDPGNVTHPVLGIKWSPDGLFLASGHKGGIVKCMDWRVNKTFELKPPHGKTAHKGGVKSLSWAPWSPHILATGGNKSDHTVRIWSLAHSDMLSPTTTHSLSFSSAISSLHFSPHTTELLSTHGAPVLKSSGSATHLHLRRRSTGTDNAVSATHTPPTQHALLVHAYPSLQRVHTVSDAHGGLIVDSVIAPNGTRVITFGEDESLRMWTVWGERKKETTCSMMNKYRMR